MIIHFYFLRRWFLLLIEISRQQFVELEKGKFFVQYQRTHGIVPFNRSGRKYYVVDDKDTKTALSIIKNRGKINGN